MKISYSWKIHANQCAGVPHHKRLYSFRYAVRQDKYSRTNTQASADELNWKISCCRPHCLCKRRGRIHAGRAGVWIFAVVFSRLDVEPREKVCHMTVPYRVSPDMHHVNNISEDGIVFVKLLGSRWES